MKHSVTLTLESTGELTESQKEKLIRILKKAAKKVRPSTAFTISDIKTTLSRTEIARKAGFARAESMTKTQRSELARKGGFARAESLAKHTKTKHKKRIRG